MPARATRHISDRIAQALVADRSALDEDLPPRAAVGRLDDVLLIGDFLSPLDEIRAVIEGISARGARGHILMVVDPVEETFPFAGQAVLHDVEDGIRLRVGDAASWGESYRGRIAGHRDAIAEMVRQRGWTLTIHRTDRPASTAALRIVTLLAATRGTNLAGQ
jgi:uncharacterized protein (DUF58 family)